MPEDFLAEGHDSPQPHGQRRAPPCDATVKTSCADESKGSGLAVFAPAWLTDAAGIECHCYEEMMDETPTTPVSPTQRTPAMGEG